MVVIIPASISSVSSDNSDVVYVKTRKRSSKSIESPQPLPAKKGRIITLVPTKMGDEQADHLEYPNDNTPAYEVCVNPYSQGASEALNIYYFEAAKPQLLESLASSPLSTEDRIMTSRKKPYLTTTPYPILMTWKTQAWPHCHYHHSCRAMHRFMVTKLIMAKCRI